jgi:hypothetical protein
MMRIIRSGETEENDGIYESGQPVCGPRFEVESYGMESRSSNQSAGMLGTVTQQTK